MGLLRPQECFLKKQQSWGQELPGQGIWGPSRRILSSQVSPSHFSWPMDPKEQHRLWLWHLCANRSMHLDFHFFSERNRAGLCQAKYTHTKCTTFQLVLLGSLPLILFFSVVWLPSEVKVKALVALSHV